MNPDDPKFTAHALGELEDLTPAERAEIEALLASDPAAAAEAQETQALAARLRAELPGEGSAPLHEAQRAAVLRVSVNRGAAKKIVRFPRLTTVLAAIAACLVVGVSIALLFPAMQVEKEAAMGSLVTGGAEARQEVMALVIDGTVLKSPIYETTPTVPELRMPEPSATTATAVTTPTFAMTATAIQPAELGRSLESRELGLLTAPAAPAPQSSNSLPQDASTVGNGGLSKAIANGVSNFKDGWAKGGASSISGIKNNSAPSNSADVARGLRVLDLESNVKPMPVATLAPQQRTLQQGTTRSVDANTVKAGTIALTQLEADGSSRIALVEKPKSLKEIEDRQRDNKRQELANTEAFDVITDNAFLTARENPLSTFSIDVDTASYAIVRRFLNDNQRPPKGAVRIEELLNYFTYDYPPPQADAPFAATMEVATCPWATEHRLVRIGLKGREIARDKRPASNLVFLIDVSGSMQPENKLPLLKQSLGLLIDQLGDEDQVAMVVYAGSSGCVLEPTRDKRKMHAALGKLEAGGSTNGASGIQLAYQLAEKSFIKGGTNRVILATDGDWNVGVTSQSDLLDVIAQKAKSGVFLTVMGFGMGNLKDSMLVKLADHGSGNYAYIDTLLEAKKVLVEQLSGTLVTIAKDVKIQVEFNPAQVSSYRLIGYEKRVLAKEDFNDDKKDAGEIGAGHTVTALYEVVPVGKEPPQIAQVDALKYQPTAALEPKPSLDKPEAKAAAIPGKVGHELLTLKLRYKAPDGDTSKLLEFPLTDAGATWENSTRDFRFAAAVAGYGLLLRDSPHKGQATWSAVAEWAQEGRGTDASGYRAEFLALLEKARSLTR